MKPNDPHWYSETEVPMTIASAEAFHWDRETDVAVIGAGAAGASAALEACAQGASVLLVDRFTGGGASAISGGVIYMGGGTKYQQQAGFNDTPQNMFNYLKLETRGIVGDETLKKFCDDSIPNLQWLEKHGVSFDASMSPVKTSYPTNKYFLYYSGNELVKEFTDVATPAPRGHRVKWKGFSGAGLMDALLRSCRKTRVQTAFMSRVTQLVQNNEGRVLGFKMLQIPPHSPHADTFASDYKWFCRLRMFVPAIAQKLRARMEKIEREHAVMHLVRVRKGLVLAAGGFIFNRDMAKFHAPKYAAGAPLGSLGCNGSGIRLGESIGAATGNMQRGSAWRFINPPKAWVQGIIVNRKGKRFVNEQCYGARIGEFMCEENDGIATLIFNRAMLRNAFSQLRPGKVWLMLQTAPALLSILFNTHKARSIDALAKKCAIPPECLAKTLAHYNAACAGKEEDAMHKSPEFMRTMLKGPYYAMDISLKNKRFICPVISLGGLLVDEKTGQVKREDGSLFPNLYAAGRTAVGVASQSYVSGLSLADCIFSGRRAGKQVAANEH